MTFKEAYQNVKDDMTVGQFIRLVFQGLWIGGTLGILYLFYFSSF